MEDNLCTCTHSKDDHVAVLIKPDGVNGETTGQILKCTICLCQDFEPQEAEAKE